LTAADVIAGAKGKPAPFEFFGFTYLLRPLTRSEVVSLREWSAAEAGKAGFGEAMQTKIVALALCDESGKPLFEEPQVAGLPNAAINALADEIARRNWEPPEGKADSVGTTA
jgi:hypothetical protein